MREVHQPLPKVQDREMRKYRLISKRGEGTFSEVIKAQNTKTGNFYAIKCMKSAYKSAEQVRRRMATDYHCHTYAVYCDYVLSNSMFLSI